MLCHAQEIALIRQLNNSAKLSTPVAPLQISKLAAALSLKYAEIENSFGNLKLFPKSLLKRRSEWPIIISTKVEYFKAFANFYRAKVHETKTELGLAVSRLELALFSIKQATKSISSANTSFLSLIQNHENEITQMHKICEHDNDIVYHQIVPKSEDLPSLESIFLSKICSLQDQYKELEKGFSDLFSELIPLYVTEGMSLYSEDLSKLLRYETGLIDAADSEMSKVDLSNDQDNNGNKNIVKQSSKSISQLFKDIDTLIANISPILSNISLKFDIVHRFDGIRLLNNPNAEIGAHDQLSLYLKTKETFNALTKEYQKLSTVKVTPVASLIESSNEESSQTDYDSVISNIISQLKSMREERHRLLNELKTKVTIIIWASYCTHYVDSV